MSPEDFLEVGHAVGLLPLACDFPCEHQD
jgi:hypothetical protein